MIENNPTNVASAFEMLLEEVETEIDFVNGVGAKAFEGRDYDRAKEALEQAGTLAAFRDRVASLRKEWDELAAAAESQEDEETKAERRNLGRLRRGLRTPEREPARRLRALGQGGPAQGRFSPRTVGDLRKRSTVDC